jgi:hypothetical protein
VFGAIQENRPEFGSQESTSRIGGSLGTIRTRDEVAARASRLQKKSVTQLGVTRVAGKIDVVGETLHWGIYEAFQRHQ